MAESRADEYTCTDCGVTITGVPVVPVPSDAPTQAQIEKLKPTVYLCVECAKERGLWFDEMAIGRRETDAPPPAP
jgi:DNA-directed RNA polymerase subunit RPC12/RpoP